MLGLSNRFGVAGPAGLFVVLALQGYACSAETPPVAPPVAPPVEEETVSIASIPASVKHPVYLVDTANNHIVDGLVRIVDGDTLRYLATMSIGDLGLFGISRDGRQLYSAATYYEHLNRGARTDTLATYDARSLQLLSELVIPPKHAQEVAYQAFLVPSSSGPYVFVQNATPASSVSIIDLQAGTLLTEVQTAGCYGIFPSAQAALRFTSLCGDGTALTVSLDASGKEVGRARSAKLFAPDLDPLFEGAADDGNAVVFMSFSGVVHVIDVAGPVAHEVGSPMPLVGAALAPEGWRPGGEQVIAYHVETKQLFVTMHRDGKEGSHKEPADEIWQADLAKQALVRRIPAAHALSVAVTQGRHPELFGINGDDGSLSRYDVEHDLALTGRIEKPLVETTSTMFVR